MNEDLYLPIKKHVFKKINTGDIVFVEANDNYSRFFTPTDNYLIKITLTQVEAALPPEDFCRVNRTYIISISRITDIDIDIIYLDDKQIPLARQYRQKLLSRLKILR